MGRPRRFLKTRGLVAWGLVLSAAVACIDDPTLVDDDPIPLSREEAELLGLEVWRTFFEASLAAETDPDGASAVGPAAAPVTFSESVDTTFACELGGTIDSYIAISGSGDDETGEAELTLEIVQTHRGCAQDVDGGQFTLDGRPNLDAIFSFSLHASDSITLGGSITGAIRAAAGGRSGLCAANVTFGGGLDAAGTGEFYVTGTMCGAAVDESVVIE